jgi:ribonucleoside-diphosphate reductase alpha chain
MDHKILNTSLVGKNVDINENELPFLLDSLRKWAVEINKEFAGYLGIEESASITCVKPSGTVSQLVDSASGIHPRYGQYYIRRVRLDKTDPLGDYMIRQGFQPEEDFYKKSNWVFSFPMKAPDGAVTRNDRSAIEQLELWKIYQEHYCEHKPSITIYVGDDEWVEVGAWVYKNLNSVSGVSFLPRDNGTYRQAPYEDITKEKYEELVAAQAAIHIDWTGFKEETDTTTSAKELACSAGSCEIG